jgi:hypothetical protein
MRFHHHDLNPKLEAVQARCSLTSWWNLVRLANASLVFLVIIKLSLSLVDPNLSSNQRISILVKKIQELKKTYLMIKNEMNAKDRRRKKLRRRERENKQKQTAKVA